MDRKEGYQSLSELISAIHPDDVISAINDFLVHAAKAAYDDDLVFSVVPDLEAGLITITHEGFADDIPEIGENRWIKYASEVGTCKLVPVNKFDIRFDPQTRHYHLSESLASQLGTWLVCDIDLPGYMKAYTLLSYEFTIRIGGISIDCSSKR